jgi:hypothetical protein
MPWWGFHYAEQQGPWSLQMPSRRNVEVLVSTGRTLEKRAQSGSRQRSCRATILGPGLVCNESGKRRQYCRAVKFTWLRQKSSVPVSTMNSKCQVKKPLRLRHGAHSVQHQAMIPPSAWRLAVASTPSPHRRRGNSPNRLTRIGSALTPPSCGCCCCCGTPSSILPPRPLVALYQPAAHTAGKVFAAARRRAGVVLRSLACIAARPCCGDERLSPFCRSRMQHGPSAMTVSTAGEPAGALTSSDTQKCPSRWRTKTHKDTDNFLVTVEVF